MTPPNAVPMTRQGCIEKARELAPRFAERCLRTEAERRLPDESVQDLVGSGLVRVLLPRRFGGYELDFGVVLGASLELGAACPSTAWVGSFFMNHAWVVGLFPLAAQLDVWEKNADALIATRVSRRGGRVERVAEGLVLNGRWPQTSGVDHTGWLALCANEEAAGSESLVCLVPRADVTVDDTWFASGLRGSGSKTVIAEGVFVPAYRTIRFQDFLDGTCPGGQLPGAGPLYRLPAAGGYIPILAAPIVGAARGALADCVAAGRRLAGGPGSLGPVQRVCVAQAATDLHAATLVLRHHLDDAMATVAAGRTMTMEQRARGRRDGAYATRMANRALTQLLDASPASVLYDASPVQRAWRDVRMMSAHPALHAETAGEIWTSIAYGLTMPDLASHLL